MGGSYVTLSGKATRVLWCYAVFTPLQNTGVATGSTHPHGLADPSYKAQLACKGRTKHAKRTIFGVGQGQA